MLFFKRCQILGADLVTWENRAGVSGPRLPLAALAWECSEASSSETCGVGVSRRPCCVFRAQGAWDEPLLGAQGVGLAFWV